MSKAAVNVAYTCTKKRFEKTGSARNKKCSGRPRLSTKRQDRFLEHRGLQDRFRTATRLQEDLEEIGIKSNTSTAVVVFVLKTLRVVLLARSRSLRLHISFVAFALPKCTIIAQKKTGKRSSGLTKPYLVLLDNVTKCIYAEELVKN